MKFNLTASSSSSSSSSYFSGLFYFSSLSIYLSSGVGFGGEWFERPAYENTLALMVSISPRLIA